MRAENIAFGGAVLVLVGIPTFLWCSAGTNEYLKFMDRKVTYYSYFAAACDQVVSEHSVGTNVVLWLSNTNLSPADVLLHSRQYNVVSWSSVPGSDMIKRLNPDALVLRSNSVLILVGFTKSARFGISWELQTNNWVLSVASGEAPQKLYSRPKRE